MIGWVILTTTVVALSGALIQRSINGKRIKRLGYDPKESKKSGALIGGHPEIDKGIRSSFIINGKDSFLITDVSFNPKGFIAKSLIKNVVFENATSFGQRVSAGSVALFGALAFIGKRKIENAYVIIEWNDGRFDHSTSFLFEGAGSTTKANTLRNWLIKQLK